MQEGSVVDYTEKVEDKYILLQLRSLQQVFQEQLHEKDYGREGSHLRQYIFRKVDENGVTTHSNMFTLTCTLIVDR